MARHFLNLFVCSLVLASCGEREVANRSNDLGAESPKPVGDVKVNELVGEAQKLIKRQLTDPYSAQFDDLRVNADLSVLCGSVNSKNQMGGYAGARDFVYDRNTGRALIQPFAGITDTSSMSEFELRQGIANTEAFTASRKKCGYSTLRAVGENSYSEF